MIRAGRSHGVEDHGNNTLSVLFKLKLEQMSCLSVGQKHCVSVAARRPFESPKFTKISCKPGHGLSRKKKKKHAAELPVSQGTKRMRLVLSSSGAFWYRWFSLCKKTPHTYPTHYTHAYTFNSERESCLAWFVVADHEEGEAEVKKVESLLLCLGKRAVLELQAVHDQLLWLFDNVRKLLKQELHKKAALEDSWSEWSSSTSRLIWSPDPKRHFVAIDLLVAEKTPKCMCYPILGQRKLKANNVDRQLASRKAQSSSCFDLDRDRVTVLVPRQTEVSISVWGNPRNWGIPFSRPISARLFILDPRPFPGDPVR